MNYFNKLSRSKITITILLLALASLFSSCKKDWLNAKPSKSLIVPSTIQDYQALLDNTNLMNTNHPGLGEIGTNNFYMLNTQWQSLYNFQERNAYIWTPDIFQGEYSFDWNDAYTRILNANVVIKGIEKVQTDGTSQSNWNNVKGSALFFRAYDFYDLAQEFCKPYIQSTANSDLGIPLRTDPDVSKGSVRASVQETYDQIIHDLLIAKDLLPINPLYKTRPSKPAAYALLARTYLAMENYDRALLYSDSSLQLFSALIDYNTLNASSTLPVPRL